MLDPEQSTLATEISPVLGLSPFKILSLPLPSSLSVSPFNSQLLAITKLPSNLSQADEGPPITMWYFLFDLGGSKISITISPPKQSTINTLLISTNLSQKPLIILQYGFMLRA